MMVAIAKMRINPDGTKLVIKGIPAPRVIPAQAGMTFDTEYGTDEAYPDGNRINSENRNSTPIASNRTFRI